MLWIGLISLFPEMFQALEVGITGRAIKNQLVTLHHWNPRDFTTDLRQTVDDHPYGGGPGMVMIAPPLQAAIQAAKQAAPTSHPPRVIYLSPQGRRYDQSMATELASQQAIILLAGRYEGIDERLIAQEVDEEWSIGDYILTGGELAAMVVIDAAIRLLPGAVHNPDSIKEDSLMSDLLKYPQYTRPKDWLGASVPDVLLKGHHQLITTWRLKQALGHTWLKRPDLLTKKKLNQKELGLLTEFLAEQNTRPSAKLAAESEVKGETEHRTEVYKPVHEDSSTVSATPFATTVEFRRRSTVK